MTDQTRADLATLDSLASRLRRAGDSLDEAGGTVPPPPTAGDRTPDIARLVGHLTDVTGNLVIGLREASDRVEQSRTAYSGTDTATAASMDGFF